MPFFVRFHTFKALLVITLLIALEVQATEFYGREANDKVKGASVLRINPHTNQIQFVLFEEHVLVKESEALQYMKRLYKVDAGTDFRLLRKEQDELGFTHYRYQQTVNGADVLGGVLILHCKNGRLHSINGECFKLNRPLQNINFTEKQALELAKDSIRAKSYMWEHPEEEAILKEILEDPQATYYPKAQMFFVPANLIFNHQNFQLCYKFNIHGFEPRSAENIYISVETGEVVARENQLHTTDVTGTAVTKYSGNKTIITDSTAPFNYRLRENTRGNGVYTFNMKKGTSYGLASDFLDSNNYWNNVNANKDEVATDCHWGAETTYDYYKNIHGRNSYNNNNARINSYVHYANNYDNAFWDGIRMTYGDGNTFKPLTSLDVCGHEITHAVTTYSANLIYSYESGQLNESFSDIFGNTIERYGKPNGYSWIIGEEITYNGTGLRNMLNPKLKGHPRCYKSTNWYFGAGDNGGVHLNSGVQNWWYYLITEGGSGTNDVSNVFSVDSLGIAKAEKIAYRNLTVYLTPTSQYADARFYSIRSAIDLYGNCSKEVISVTNAWYACNVGPKYDSGFVKADFSADTIICKASKLVNFYNLSTNASSCKWYFGDGDTSTLFNPTHTYSNYGSFTIKLLATSCFFNKKDSVTKVAYVKVDSTYDICNAVFMPVSGIDSTHKCESFVYDDGGEDIYTQNKITYLRISIPGADSIRITFKDFDYETGYDSLYIYRGKFPGAGIKVGGYTGTTLPNGGNVITIAGSVATLRHVSDPYVVGRGFKLHYKAFRQTLAVKAYSDTSICYGTDVWLKAEGTGGYKQDYRFRWSNQINNDSILVSPLTATQYKVYLTDVCTQAKDSSVVTVSVYEPLSLSLSKDTVVCSGATASVYANAKGGKASSYQYSWDNGLGQGKTKTVAPGSTTKYRVILSDACTPVNDTGFVTVFVKPPLKVDIQTNDTDICYGKTSALQAKGSGGDTMAYAYVWSNGLGLGSHVVVPLTASRWAVVTLTDNCSSVPAKDSVFISVREPLTVKLGNDTTICNGRGVTLNAIVSGGKPSNLRYTWNSTIPDTSRYTVKPEVRTVYKIEADDQCSDMASDSILVDLYGPIVVTGTDDTLICVGQSAPIQVSVTGGISSAYNYNWNLGLGNAPNHIVSPLTGTQYRVIVTDGCTVLGDTGYVQVHVNPVLKARISTNDTLLCYNKIGQYSVVGIGGVPANYSYSWNISTSQKDSIQMSLTDSVWIVARVKDACTVKDGIDSVFVAVRPEMILDIGNDTSICYGTSLNLNAVATGGDASAYSLLWNQGLASQFNHVVKPGASIFYRATLSDNCSDPVFDSIRVDVLPPLKLSNIRDTTICSGGTATIHPLAFGGKTADYTYSWSNGLSSLPDQVLSPLSTTQYKLVLSDNCTVPNDSAFVTVTVLPPLSIQAEFIDSTICNGDTAVLNMNFNGGKVAAYQWFVNGAPYTSNQLKVAPNSNTTFRIELKDFCSDDLSKSLNLVVYPLPQADFNSAKTSICLPELVRFNNLSTGGNLYLWHFGDGDSSTAFEPAKFYQTAGNYHVGLTVTSAEGCTDSVLKPQYVSVVERPVADFDINPDKLDYLNSEATFINNSEHYTTFEWNFGDNQSSTSSSNPVHTYSDTGIYWVSLIVKNDIGCADTMLKPAQVWDVFRFYIPDAISVNNDNVNDSFVVRGRGIHSYRMRVYSRWGEKVYDGNQDSKAFDGRWPNGEMLMKGTYVVEVIVRDFGGFMHYIRQVVEVL